MEPYYYSQMNKVQQNAYHAMKTGLMSMAPLFMVPKLENRELGDIFSSCAWTVRKYSMHPDFIIVFIRRPIRWK